MTISFQRQLDKYSMYAINLRHRPNPPILHPGLNLGHTEKHHFTSFRSDHSAAHHPILRETVRAWEG